MPPQLSESQRLDSFFVASVPALCGYGSLVVALALGAFVAALIDDTALAWKVTEDSHVRFVSGEPRPLRKPPAVSVGVGVLPYRGGAGLGMAGQF